ncbi:hypothetical protein BV25DRAFT_1922888, partial [Artomyces pyxidatus]
MSFLRNPLVLDSRGRFHSTSSHTTDLEVGPRALMLRPAVVNQLDHGNPMETPREQHSAPPRAPPRPIWTPSYTRPVDPDYQEIRELLRGPFEGPHTQELERIAYHLCAALFWSEQVLAAPHWKETR